MKYHWINLFPLAPEAGFVYFEACVQTATNQVLGWITRSESSEPYVYSVHLLNGSRVKIHERGTFQHARWNLQGAIESSAKPVSVHLDHFLKTVRSTPRNHVPVF